MWDAEKPAITTMLRGLVGEEITITATDRDLHSGMYGGLARNPIQVLADILDGLHDENGRVTLPNFYDGVIEMFAEVMEMWDKIGFSGDAFLGDIGLKIPAGENDRTPLEKIWTRPTCEINGISGDYQGAGFKTVIASKASAKVSFRLVGDQDPKKIRETFRAYVRAKVPGGLQGEVCREWRLARALARFRQPLARQGAPGAGSGVEQARTHRRIGRIDPRCR